MCTEKKNKREKYEATARRQMRAKAPQQGCRETCKFKCHEKFTGDERKPICDAYYNLGDYALQRDFICSRIEEREPVRKKDGGNKSISREHSFLKTAGEEYLHISVRVCYSFFCATLDISY